MLLTQILVAEAEEVVDHEGFVAVAECVEVHVVVVIPR